ncbi:cytoplasmic protein [bacterium (Candidatus Blackallbacteria) CG13_big_fil_rev_8_21_14_2_50_49_14]|nr:MAG: cytoplasmic protein [bacterium (Candidatus Blackallbacteria) CG18_big_fil_WC_8_21_14_2_50_49_26]PIW46630.1 MAG: cytoplasmic protein [bacterium (Candidatus Blackallbacteria) CG13_big_fil_rev_8_21_14_2_50_49_14]
MPDIMDIARAERETLRWIILSALWHARPYGCSEYLILRTAQDVPLRVTQDQVRQEMHYLKGRHLIEVNDNQPLWHATITPDGEDLVDYRSDCPAGIARPPKW